jgi:hypothetical protein
MAKVTNLEPIRSPSSTKITSTPSTGAHTKNLMNTKTKNDPLPSPVRRFLSEIGKRGGSATSDKKRLAAALNGMKGGRPRKVAVAYEA